MKNSQKRVFDKTRNAVRNQRSGEALGHSSEMMWHQVLTQITTSIRTAIIHQFYNTVVWPLTDQIKEDIRTKSGTFVATSSTDKK